MHTFGPSPRIVLLCILIVLVTVASLLPIPVRAQSTTASRKEVQFPASSDACTSCKPAFSTPACQTILHSISQSSTSPISNSTLSNCQCTDSFLSLYPTCVQCFSETNQMRLVFGSGQAPSLASLKAYCDSLPEKTSATATKTMSKESTPTPTASPEFEDAPTPNSALALRMQDQSGVVAPWMVSMTAVAVWSFALF
ncbi:hypothetical protein BGZ51_008001 [Haplosporangium sp. Z 767]|nr:hypothetical protein BGZ51_008001 [Haplosporangium sp. Z 767]KAF9191123.1 hypothetical protein BGZ50_009651 [Haplosporangium sp. Z 11]